MDTEAQITMDTMNHKDKPDSVHIENQTVDKNPQTLTPAQQRRLLWRIDWHILPMLAVIYATSVIDKANIGSAKVQGMTQDLDLGTGNRYSVILLLFFPGYVLANIPANWLLVHLTPRYWLSFLIIGWGAVMVGMAFTNNWQVMAFLRFLLGGLEGGVFPAMVYIIGSWYSRYEMHRRLSLCYSLALLSGAASGFLAYALGLLGGTRGMLGWRWIFSIEGAASMLIGIVAIFTTPTFPDLATWFKPQEREFLMTKLRNDRGDFQTEKITLKDAIECAKDWKVWLLVLMFCFNTSSVYCMAFFSPSILTGLGYSGLQATLYSAYPQLTALGLLLFGSYVSDKTHLRSPVMLVQGIIQLAGFIIMRPYYSNQIRYLGIHLATMGASANGVALLVFSQNNTIGSAKRAVTSAIVIGFGVTGGIIGSTIFRQQDAPSYGPGVYTTIAMTVFNLLALVVLVFAYYRRNCKADRENRDIAGIPGYRYSY